MVSRAVGVHRVSAGQSRVVAAACVIVITAGIVSCGSGRTGGGKGASVPNTGPATQSAASCVAPTLTASKASAHIGDSLKVVGHWFVRECHDVVINGETPAANAPMRAVPPVLRTKRGQVFDVGTARPDGTGSFSMTVRAPARAVVGPATVVSRDGFGIPVKIMIRK